MLAKFNFFFLNFARVITFRRRDGCKQTFVYPSGGKSPVLTLQGVTPPDAISVEREIQTGDLTLDDYRHLCFQTSRL